MLHSFRDPNFLGMTIILHFLLGSDLARKYLALYVGIYWYYVLLVFPSITQLTLFTKLCKRLRLSMLVWYVKKIKIVQKRPVNNTITIFHTTCWFRFFCIKYIICVSEFLKSYSNNYISACYNLNRFRVSVPNTYTCAKHVQFDYFRQSRSTQTSIYTRLYV